MMVILDLKAMLAGLEELALGNGGVAGKGESAQSGLFASLLAQEQTGLAGIPPLAGVTGLLPGENVGTAPMDIANADPQILADLVAALQDQGIDLPEGLIDAAVLASQADTEAVAVPPGLQQEGANAAPSSQRPLAAVAAAVEAALQQSSDKTPVATLGGSTAAAKTVASLESKAGQAIAQPTVPTSGEPPSASTLTLGTSQAGTSGKPNAAEAPSSSLKTVQEIVAALLKSSDTVVPRSGDPPVSAAQSSAAGPLQTTDAKSVTGEKPSYAMKAANESTLLNKGVGDIVLAVSGDDTDAPSSALPGDRTEVPLRRALAAAAEGRVTPESRISANAHRFATVEPGVIAVPDAPTQPQGVEAGSGNARTAADLNGNGSVSNTKAPASTELPQFERPTLRTVGDFAVKSVRYLVNNGESTMKVKLIPENLGEMRLTINKVGESLQIHVVAGTQAVREAIEAQLQGLRDHLVREGLDVGRITVSPDSSSGGTHHSAGRHGPGSDNAPRFGNVFRQNSGDDAPEQANEPPSSTLTEDTLNIYV